MKIDGPAVLRCPLRKSVKVGSLEKFDCWKKFKARDRRRNAKGGLPCS